MWLEMDQYLMVPPEIAISKPRCHGAIDKENVKDIVRLHTIERALEIREI
jgi:hypothetical protein